MICSATNRAGGWVGRLLAMLAALFLLAPTSVRAELYGHAIAQPYFDYPSWARFSHCRPGSLPWGYEVFPEFWPGDCADCGYPPVESVSCIDEFVAHRPNDWYASADFVPLTIDYQRDVEFARIGPLGPTALSTSDLDPEFNAGGKFTVGRRFGGCYRLEGTYLGAYQWNDSAIVTNNDPIVGGFGNLSSILSQFADPEVPGLDQNNLVSVANQSQMHNAELNLRYWVDVPPGPFDVSLLVGARYMNIEEEFDFLSVSAVPGPAVNAVGVNTDNDMWGVQVGIATDWLVHPRCWLNMDIKATMFDNQASQITSYTTDIGGVITNFPTEAAQSRTSWLFDLSLVSHWQVRPNLVFNLGYQATFVQGVAIAYENLQTDNTLLQTGPGVLNDSGNLVYHGPVIGLTWVR